MSSHRLLRFLIPLSIALAAGGLILFPLSTGVSQVQAQGGYDSPCETMTTTFYLDTYIDNDAGEGGYTDELVDNPTGALWDDGSRIHIVADSADGGGVMATFSGGGIYSGTFKITVDDETLTNVWERKFLWNPNYNAAPDDPEWHIVYNYALPGNNFTAEFGTIGIWIKASVLYDADYWLDSFQIENVSGTCEPVEDDDDDLYTCTTITDWHFTGTPTDTWVLSGGASISNSQAIIPPGEVVAQNLDTLVEHTDYNALISVTTTLTPGIEIPLLVTLGIETNTITITGTDIYTAAFTTPGLAGPIAYILQNDSPTYDVAFGWTCLYRGDDANECVAPYNGTFDTSMGWYWRGNADHNNTAKNAFIPFNDPAAYSDPNYVAAYINTYDVFTLPEIATGEYLLVSFEAQTMNNNDGLIDNWVKNISQTITYEHTFQVYPQKYLFEADISGLAGESAWMLFGNDGGYPDYSDDFADDLSLDNVCVFISDRPANMPTPIDPGTGFDPVETGSWYTCDDIPAIMVYWGVDIRYHRINYQNTPSVWDPQDWVPWLISAFWVMVEMHFCLFLVAVKTMFNLVEYLLNNGLNFGFWGVQSFDSFSSFLRTTAYDWLIWLALSVLEFATVPDEIVSNLFILALWVLFGFTWLGGLFLPLLLWLITGGDNVLRTLLNILIEDGWNAFLIALGGVIGNLISVFVGIWNDSILPFFQFLLGYMGPLVFVLFDLFPKFWAFFWSVLIYMWVNFVQVVSLPLSFYTGLSEGINSGAFSALASCDGTADNFWCGLFGGLDLVNGVAGHSIFYPIVIVGIIIATIAILYRNVIAWWNIISQYLTKL